MIILTEWLYEERHCLRRFGFWSVEKYKLKYALPKISIEQKKKENGFHINFENVAKEKKKMKINNTYRKIRKKILIKWY